MSRVDDGGRDYSTRTRRMEDDKDYCTVRTRRMEDDKDYCTRTVRTRRMEDKSRGVRSRVVRHDIRIPAARHRGEVDADFSQAGME